MSSVIIPRVIGGVDDPYSDQESTTSDDIKRRSWLSHLSSSVETTATTTPCSHRSSFSSTFSAATTNTTLTTQQPQISQPSPFASPKPHKSNQPLWDSMRRLRTQIQSHGGREVGLEHFKLIKRVGSGDLGSVYLCQIRGVNNNNSLYAMKVVDREALAGRNKLGRAEVEREILCMLDHPFLPTLYAQFDASHYSCLVMEFCPGGDLYSARLKQPSKRFSVSSTKFYAAEVLLALEYLHMMGIIYRDLKPENVLVREDGHIMLSDFDLCLKCNDVVPKLLLLKQQQQKQQHPMTSSTRSISSSPPQSDYFTPSCAGPLRPVLTSCFSLRRSTRQSSTTTITEYASSSSTQSAAVTNNNNNDRHVSIYGDEEESEYYSDCPSESSSVHSSVMYQRWATEMVAEPIEARSKSFVGTHEYLAPEVISGQGHGSAVDWWTFGVFLYEMLFGVTPFKGENNERTLRNILKQPLTFPPPHHHRRSNYHNSHREEEEERQYLAEMDKAKDLIRRLLVKNPKRRIGSVKGSVEIKKHEFFRGVNWALIRSVKPPVVPSSGNHDKKQQKMTMRMNEVDQRKVAVMMMMKKKKTTVNTNTTPRSFSSGLSFVLPKVLTRKERDQPYQIPFQYDHDRTRDERYGHHHHSRRDYEHQKPRLNQRFEYF